MKPNGGKQYISRTTILSFPHECFSDRTPYFEVRIGRNGADSVLSFGGSLSRSRNETISETGVGERTFSKSVSVPTAESEPEDTPESADACWRPHGQNNIGTPYTVEDRGSGHLAWPAVHQFDVVGLPVPERAGSPVIGLQT